MSAPPLWPFALHLVYEDPALIGGDASTSKFIATLTDELYSELSSSDRAARVPVRLWRSQLQKNQRVVPSRVPLEWASKNVVVVIVDPSLFERRAEWNTCIRTLVAEAKPERDLILPLSIQTNAARVADAFADVNHLAVQSPDKRGEDERVRQAIYTAILRLLVPQLPRVFLCHSKADGAGIAKRVRRYVYEESQLKSFFDMHDIPHGHQVKQSIKDSIGHSAVLVIWTDKLLDSPWCQLEIIEARRQQRPMLILDALTSKTPRLFPYMGNMPVMRWTRQPSPVVSAMLLELIRTYHLEALYQSRAHLDSDPPTFCLHPPDIIESSLESSRRQKTSPSAERSEGPPELWVYPDPPLKHGEYELLRELVRHKRFLSLVEWQALRAAGALQVEWDHEISPRPAPLRGMRIGISVSPTDTWADIGLSARHQDDLSFQIALQLILLGAKVVWAGDLREDGLGDQLRGIVAAYQHPTRASQDHVALVVPFTPNPERTLKPADLDVRRAFAEVRVMHSPVAASTPLDPNSPDGRALSALALSTMRAELARDCHARIVLGGGMQGFQGLYPGVVEEAYETVRNERPLFIIGGFGGAARVVYDAVAESPSTAVQSLLDASHTGRAGADEHIRRAHASMTETAGAPELAFDPERMAGTFSRLGLAGLAKNNALSSQENERLAESQNLQDILELVVKGLSALTPRA
jgi:hypothetical protein